MSVTTEDEEIEAMQRRFDAIHGAADWPLWHAIDDECQNLCDECANFEESCSLTGRVCPECATWPIRVGETTWGWLEVAKALR